MGVRQSAMKSLTNFSNKLMLGTMMSGVALVAPTAAIAQNESVTVTGTSIRGTAPPGANVITVDRASIEASSAATIQQLLTSVPQINIGFGQSGQNTEGGAGGASGPTIHSLGAQGSNATLVLINGRRIPALGATTTIVDPSAIPSVALQRVEVLPDGASAIYGADAVAGVLNFITRREYSGWETSAQYGIADKYNSFNASQLFGHAWDTGSVLAVYNYTSRSRLMNVDRDYITARQDIRRGQASPVLFTAVPTNPPAGSLVSLPALGAAVSGSGAYRGMAIPYPSTGSNFQNFNCPVAAISATTNSAAFLYPYTTAANTFTVANGAGGTTTQVGLSQSATAPAQGVCDTLDEASSLPSNVRNSMMVSMRQALTDRIMASVDLVYSANFNRSAASRGSVTATVFRGDTIGGVVQGTGGPSFGTGQRNPFFVPVPGSTANSQVIRMNFDDLLRGIGPAAGAKLKSYNMFATPGVDVDLGGDWSFSLGSTFGTSETVNGGQGQIDSGSLNASQALLALNGTVNTNGTRNSNPTTSALVDSYGLGTVVSVTRALTTANALDVWNPKETNRTNPAVLRSLLDSSSYQTRRRDIQDVTIKFDGPLFDLGTGMIKTAFGGEYLHLTQNTYVGTMNNAGPASTSSNFNVSSRKRTAYAAFAEFLIPLINADMGVPLVQDFKLNVSGRYDRFSDFGITMNPKVGIDWVIADGLKARGSYGTSFVPIQLNFLGTGVRTYSPGGIGAGRTYLFNSTLDYSNSPELQGGGIAGTFASNAVSCAQAGATPVDAAGNVVTTAPYTGAVGCRMTAATNGLTVGGTPLDVKPEIGVAYSAGLDVDFGRFWDLLEGLAANVTFYDTKFIGIHTNQSLLDFVPKANAFGPACGSDSTNFTPGNVGCRPGWAPTDPAIAAALQNANLGGVLPDRIYTIADNAVQNAATVWQNGLDFDISYRLPTEDYGTFTFGVSGNQILRFSQRGGYTGPVIDIKNGNNAGRFTGIETTGTARIDWRMEPFTARLTISYQRPYNDVVTAFPYGLAGPGRQAGFAHISAYVNYDVNFTYDIPEDLMPGMEGMQVFTTINNVLDTPPPYINATSGNAGFNQIGRLVTLGFRKKW